MNEEIILNECRNDGSTIHIYYNAISGAWISYGISAFLLRNLCDGNGIPSIESYSEVLQMPSVFIVDIVDLNKCAASSRDIDSSYYILTVNEVADDDRYLPWASSLRKAMN